MKKMNQNRKFFLKERGEKLSNGYLPANLANSSTRAKLAVFGKCEYSPKRPFSEMCETRQTRRHSPSRVARTRQTRRHSPSRVARTCQTRRHSPCSVARTRQTREGEFGEFGEFYANLASLANLANVG